ncbi:uncharacterized protein METZ01_LOCUS159490, partial [marine metagenome]
EFKWSGREDLNLRPLDPQSSTLPDCATSRYFYAMKKIELYSLRLVAFCVVFAIQITDFLSGFSQK